MQGCRYTGVQVYSSIHVCSIYRLYKAYRHTRDTHPSYTLHSTYFKMAKHAEKVVYVRTYYVLVVRSVAVRFLHPTNDTLTPSVANDDKHGGMIAT